jgi:hypothetical protein
VTAPTPPTIVTPEELVELLGLSAEEADRVSKLVQVTIEAYIWPTLVPDPVPPPMHVVGLALAARFAGAQVTTTGAITSETIGAYSYRLAQPLTFDDVVLLIGDLADALNPWSPRHATAFDVSIAGAPPAWPADYWQRNFDNVLKAIDEAASA